MERIKLGRSGLEVSPVCFGCWQMGGSYWGEVDEDALGRAVHRAVEVGVNFFDNADAYGDGAAESRLGRFIEDIDREKLVIATKVYHHWLEEPGSKRVPDLSYDYIIEECEASLRRLGIDHVDLYQAHAVDQFTHLEETTRAFDKLKRDGKIRAYGLSNYSGHALQAALALGDYDTVQPPYNLMRRGIEGDVLPICLANDLGVLCYGALHKGMLTGKFDGTETFDDLRSRMDDFQGERFRRNVEAVEQMRPIAEKLGKSVTQLALRFVLDHPAVHCAIVGIKNAAQIEDAAGAMGWSLGREDYYDLRRLF
ncbi:MAG: aldo/keto reductase [Planctomycetota bacterium]